MYKQIFKKEDGRPSLIESDEFNSDIYTDIQPPEGIYQPFYYDGNEWVGTSKEEWESNQHKPPVEPSDNDFLNAQLISNDMEHNAKIESLQQDIANLTSELLDIKGGMNNVSDT